MQVDEAIEWPDPEPVDGISLLPQSAEAVSARAALDGEPDFDDAFGADAGERHWPEPDDGADQGLGPIG